MDDSDKKIVSEDVDYMEVPESPDGAAGFSMSEQREGFANGGSVEPDESAEKTLDTPTSRTRLFFRNLRQDGLMRLNAGAVPFAGGLGILAAAGGNLKLAAVEGVIAVGAAVKTGIRNSEINRENEKKTRREERRAAFNRIARNEQGPSNNGQG